jgi:DNA-binding transcriptional ArsR family regulator
VSVLHILLIDDDPEVLDLLAASLPSELRGHELRWDPCGNFDEALLRVKERRYDVVATDIYRDRNRPGEEKTPVTAEPRAGTIVEEIRGHRFSPLLLFTDGVFPPDYEEGPFIKLADKSPGNDEIVAKLEELIATGVPELASRLHDELDRSSGSYLWEFLEQHWSSLREAGLTDSQVLDRLVRRRAATQLGRLDPETTGVAERAVVEGAEFYLYPAVADEYRLGEIVVDPSGRFRVVLTPHCHLTVQPGTAVPRADYVLTAKTVEASVLFAEDPLTGSTQPKRVEALRRRIQSPADIGRPAGRYWFLPGFLEMPHLYVDLLQLESLAYDDLKTGYRRFAVLDVPFAEALQSCFGRFYSAVGLPVLQQERFPDLLG